MDKKHYVPIFVAIGFAFLSVWPDLIGHSSGLANSADMVSEINNARVFFLCGLTCAGISHALFPRWHKRVDGRVGPAVALVSFIATLCLSFPNVLFVGSPTIWCMVCLGIVGLGYGWMVIRLLSQLAQEADFSKVVWVIAAGLLVKTVLVSILSNYFPAFVQTGIVILSPLITFAMSFLCQRTLDASEQTIDLAELPKLHGADMRVMIIAVVAVAPLRAMVRILSNMGFWGSDYAAPNLVSGLGFLLVVGLIILFSWLTLVREQEGDLITRFMTPFLVILGGFFFLDPGVSGLIPLNEWIDYVVIIFLELFSCVLNWTMIVLAVRQLETYPYRIIGGSYMVYGSSSILFALLLQHANNIDSTLIILAMYFFFIVLMLIFRTSKKTDKTKEHSESQLNVAEEDTHILEVAREAGLSPRETEVFVLLAQGRSRTYIQNELFLAAGTVKTHTTRIYAKLGVNSKMDLITKARQ